MLCWAPAAYSAGVDMFDAARAGDVTAATRYLDGGGEIEARTEQGYTPFILATYHGHDALAALLKKRGADACAVDNKGSDALMGVAFRGHLSTAKWLIAHGGCDINHTNREGQTALMMASLFGREAVIDVLLAHGADPNMVDRSGNTAAKLADMQGLEALAAKLKLLMQ